MFNKCLSLALLLTLSGSCTTTRVPSDPYVDPMGYQAGLPSAKQQENDNIEEDAPPLQDTLSYGMVRGRVETGKTTQLELLELFGGPNTMTTDKEGREVWVYDRTSSRTASSTTSRSQQRSSADAQALASFFGGRSQAAVRASSQERGQTRTVVQRSIRSITVIVSFDNDGVVQDYSVRQSQY